MLPHDIAGSMTVQIKILQDLFQPPPPTFFYWNSGSHSGVQFDRTRHSRLLHCNGPILRSRESSRRRLVLVTLAQVKSPPGQASKRETSGSITCGRLGRKFRQVNEWELSAGEAGKKLRQVIETAFCFPLSMPGVKDGMSGGGQTDGQERSNLFSADRRRRKEERRIGSKKANPSSQKGRRAAEAKRG